MRPDRRQILSALAASLLPSIARAAKAAPPAAMLLPSSGSNAALGRAMARAAALAQGRETKGLIVLDDRGTPQGAAAAATAAIKGGAPILLGPLRGEQVAPVLAAAGGRVPVLAFSNDPGVIGDGAFQLGLTPAQVVTPLLRYARGRGVRRLALAPNTGAWGRQVGEVATRLAPALDLAIVANEPDALLTGERGAVPNGVQLLVAGDGLDWAASDLAGWEGAWLAAPDPDRFGEFVSAYEAANGATPGLIAGLAYDASRIAAVLRASGGSDRSALLARAFPGVCGDVRFRADGSADRSMAIVAVERGRYLVVERGGAAT